MLEKNRIFFRTKRILASIKTSVLVFFFILNENCVGIFFFFDLKKKKLHYFRNVGNVFKTEIPFTYGKRARRSPPSRNERTNAYGEWHVKILDRLFIRQMARRSSHGRLVGGHVRVRRCRVVRTHIAGVRLSRSTVCVCVS